MTNKAKMGLALVALHQLDIVWDKNPDECTVTYWFAGEATIISRAKVEHTLTRHTDALDKALEGIMDSFLGKGYKIPAEASK
jgi:hypothetical protein